MNHLLRDAFAEHLILRFEELDLADELVAAAAGQDEQQGLARSFHDGILLENLLASASANLFVHRRFKL
jgi:hypothetical protein